MKEAMKEAAPWMKFVGLPYRLGADPVGGEASDCVRMVFRVTELGGVKTPKIERKWYLWLAQGNMDAIKKDWFDLTEQTNGPEQYAMTLLGEGVFSIAVVVDGGLLTVRSTVGVQWVPLTSLRPMNFRRFKNV
jgi:hypothetical protein